MNFGTLCIIFEGWNILLNNEFRMYGPRVIYYLIYKTDLNGNIIEENPMDSVFFQKIVIVIIHQEGITMF